MRSPRQPPSSLPDPHAREGWRIVGVVTSVVATGCLLLLIPAVGDALNPQAGATGGLLAIFVIPVAPLCAVLALIAATVAALRRDRLGAVFAAAGLVMATMATLVIALLGGYGFVRLVAEGWVTALEADPCGSRCAVGAPPTRTAGR